MHFCLVKTYIRRLLFHCCLRTQRCTYHVKNCNCNYWITVQDTIVTKLFWPKTVTNMIHEITSWWNCNCSELHSERIDSIRQIIAERVSRKNTCFSNEFDVLEVCLIGFSGGNKFSCSDSISFCGHLPEVKWMEVHWW